LCFERLNITARDFWRVCRFCQFLKESEELAKTMYQEIHELCFGRSNVRMFTHS
jgi:hypothetical protein